MLGLASWNVIGSIIVSFCWSGDSDLASPATEKSVTHFQKRAEDTDGESFTGYRQGSNIKLIKPAQKAKFGTASLTWGKGSQSRTGQTKESRPFLLSAAFFCGEVGFRLRQNPVLPLARSLLVDSTLNPSILASCPLTKPRTCFQAVALLRFCMSDAPYLASACDIQSSLEQSF